MHAGESCGPRQENGDARSRPETCAEGQTSRPRQRFCCRRPEGEQTSGVSERTLQLLNHVADVALASRPKNLHEIKLQAAEGQWLGDLAGRRDAILEKADHLRNKTTPQMP